MMHRLVTGDGDTDGLGIGQFRHRLAAIAAD